MAVLSRGALRAGSRMAVVGVVVVLAGTLANAATASGGGWSVAPIANPVGATGQFLGVSCSAASSCMAVGTQVVRSGIFVTEAQRWNGKAWSVESTQNPAGAPISGLSDVSCVSASACMAVGRYFNRSGRVVTLAERWNGRRWTILPTPNPAGAAGGILAGVSCTSSSACMAVGNPVENSYESTGTLIERWNGRRWRILPTPAVHVPGSFLSGVSCTSASDCTAVGGRGPNPGPPLPLAEGWNGRRWSIQPNPAHTSRGSALSGVSCTSASTCIAVGNKFSPPSSVTLAERWNGKRWSMQRIPNPFGGRGGSQLARVACTSASNCIAVGSGGQQQGTFSRTVAEHWDGKKWRVVATPIGTPPSSFNGVACASAASCIATGNSGPVNLAEGWNGERWKLQHVRSSAGGVGSELGGVACTSATACVAVGDRTNLFYNPVAPLAEQWNGTGWRVQPTPSPHGLAGSALTAVACPSASSCMAVGFLSDRFGTPRRVFAERWDGVRWSVVPVPGPSGAAGSFLGGVACTSISACVAVGSTLNSAGAPRGTLAERWDGAHWSIMPTPNPVGASGAYLPSVSCPSPSLCLAVGSQADSTGTPTGTLVERWNGTSWTIVPTPRPAGAPGAELDGIACTSDSACIAAGAIDHLNHQTPLAEEWNGTNWTILSTPRPPGAQGGVLSGVACTSHAACTIAGLAFTTSLPYLYAERWDGNHLTFESTPALPGAFDIGNPVLACASASTCMAVGAFTNTFPNGPKFGLAERWNG
jgi:hypothetical protein